MASDVPKVTQPASWGVGLTSPQGGRSSSGEVIPGHPGLIIWKGKGLEKWECVVAGQAGGTEWGPGVWAVCMGLGRRSLESRHPPLPGICCPSHRAILQGSPLTKHPHPHHCNPWGIQWH